jgi:hypothetical protein
VAQQDHDNKRTAKIVSSIRKQFLTGKIDQRGVNSILSAYGINSQSINDYIVDWQVELTSGTKEVSAGKCVKWACDGIISLQELDVRLSNLGYDQADRQNMAVEATLCNQQRLARIAAEQQRALDKGHKAQVALQKYGCELFQKARRQIASHGSPNQLRKWFCEGTVGAPEVFDRLRFLGWTDPDITRLLSDCQKGTVAPPAVPPVGSSGIQFPAAPPYVCPPGP